MMSIEFGNFIRDLNLIQVNLYAVYSALPTLAEFYDALKIIFVFRVNPLYRVQCRVATRTSLVP